MAELIVKDVALRLGDTPGHGNIHALAVTRSLLFDEAQPTQFRVHLFGSLFPDVTGVENYEIGILGGRRLDETLRRERVHHALGIVDVHLTAIGLDMQLARRVHGT